jgi:hypothetical protein
MKFRELPWAERAAALDRAWRMPRAKWGEHERQAVKEFLFDGGLGTPADRQMLDNLTAEVGEEKAARCIVAICGFASAAKARGLRDDERAMEAFSEKALRKKVIAAEIEEEAKTWSDSKNYANLVAKKFKKSAEVALAKRESPGRPPSPEEFAQLQIDVMRILVEEPGKRLKGIPASELAFELIASALGVKPDPPRVDEARRRFSAEAIRARYKRHLAAMKPRAGQKAAK